MKRRILLRGALVAFICSGLLLVGGCAPIYRPTGVVLTHYAQDEAVPYALTSSDTKLTACGTGRGLQQLLGSFSRVLKRAHKDMMNVELLSAFCSESKAYSAQLRYLRALHAGRADEAQDAHIVQQRYERLTAERRYAAYHDFVAAFGKLGTGNCPDLKRKLFSSMNLDGAQYLVGLITSVQAILSDIQAGGAVGVPKNIARNAAKSSKCLNDKTWWGVPMALRATVWTSVPGSTPSGRNPWKTLQRAVAIGKKTGMPLAATLYALAAQNQGDTKREEQAIKDFVSIEKENKVPKKYKLLAAIGRYQVLQLSDMIWTNKTGSRTPYQGLGTFPGSNKSESNSSVNVNQYLQ